MEQVVGPLVSAVSGLIEQALTPLSDDEVVGVMRDVENCARRLVAVQHRLLIEVGDRSIPARTGAKTVKRFLVEWLLASGL